MERRRLLRSLDNGVDRPVRLVRGASGYGKTTLLSHWLKSRSYPSAWVSLDERDDRLAAFVVHVIAAIRTVFPGRMCRSLRFLSRGPVPGSAALSLALLNDLSELDERLVLVLDGVEHLGDPSVLELLSALLRCAPDRLHLVLASQKEPPLPIASLRSAIRSTEVGVDALRFTLREATELLEKSGHAPVRPETARLWVETTDGRIASLQLAIAANGGRSDPRSIGAAGISQ